MTAVTTRPKGSAFNFADQKLFTSALDVGCRTWKSAEDNTAAIIAALTVMETGGVLVIPHGVEHTFTASNFPVTTQSLCVWELTGDTFKIITNKTQTTELGELLESIRIYTPKVVGIDFVDVLETPAAYTFNCRVYNHPEAPVISGSSFDLCFFLPGAATPSEAIARSGATPGLHYFFAGIDTATLTKAGVKSNSRSIQAPATGTAVAMDATVEHLILDHATTIAALTVTLPVSPKDGAKHTIFSRSDVTALILNPGTGAIIAAGHGLTALTALQSVDYVYNAANTSWYRVR